MVSDIEVQHNLNDGISKYTGKGIKIAVMDASFNVTHPAIKHALSDAKFWYDGTYDCDGNDTKANKISNFTNPYYYHGNHTIGLISGIDHRNGKNLGLAPDATIIPVCGMNSAGISGEKLQAYYRSLNYLKKIDVKIINLSQTFLFSEHSLSLLIDMVQQGKIIVYAAGNDSLCLDKKDYSSVVLQHPILRKGLIIVGNLNHTDSRSIGYKACIGSNYVSENFRGNYIWASGENRLSASATEYSLQSGTSMAAPTIAGAIALLWEQNPNFSNETIIKILLESGSPVKDSTFPKLNVANMLSPSTQKQILEKRIINENFDKNLNQESFPDIVITSTEIQTILNYQLKNDFIFTKLTTTEINQYATSDLLLCLQKEKSRLNGENYYAYYGLFQLIEGSKVLIMPVLAFKQEEEILFIADECLFNFEDREIIFNELAFLISKVDTVQKYKDIYANWGEFEKSNSQKGLFDLHRPNVNYFKYIHAKRKQYDNFPDVIIKNKDIEELNDDDFIVFYKQESQNLHTSLINSPNEKNYTYATSSYYHSYIAKFKKSGSCVNFYAFFNKDNQIIVTYEDSFYKNWHTISRILQTFAHQVNKLGYEVFMANEDDNFQLPFYPMQVNLIPMEENHFKNEKPNSFRLDKINFYGTVGEGLFYRVIPAFLDVIMRENISAIHFYLNQKIDLNKILTTDGENALHIALRHTKNMDLIKQLVSSGIDIKKVGRYQKSPLQLAKDFKFDAAVTYLMDKLKELALGQKDSKTEVVSQTGESNIIEWT